MKRGNRKGYEFSFAWLFALIVGAVILFLAVNIAIQLVHLRQFQRESEEAKDIGVLLTPVETGLESGKFATIYVPDETKIFNDCEPLTLPFSTSDPFGSQELSLSIKPSFGGEWQKVTGVESTFHNKYIFSNKTIHGNEEFYVLSKPIYLPFKIADLIMVWSDKEIYCFNLAGAPPGFGSELRDLNMTNVFLNSASCPNVPGKRDVCFNPNCEISINIDGTGRKGTVKKTGSPAVHFVLPQADEEYSLLYAAIFSDPEIYSCHMRRLAAHALYLSEIYSQKTNYIVSDLNPCSFDNLNIAINNYKSEAGSLMAAPDPSSLLTQLNDASQRLFHENEPLSCKIF